jgi:hypothetical protein
VLVKSKKWQGKAENKNRACQYISHIENAIDPAHEFIGDMFK